MTGGKLCIFSRLARPGWTACLIVCLVWASLAAGEDFPSVRATTEAAVATPKIVGLRAGFDGSFKVGSWAPFEVELLGGEQATQGRIELTVLDGDGVPSRVRSEPLSLAPGETKRVSLDARMGRIASDVTVGFRAESGLLSSRQFQAGGDQALAGILPSSARLLLTVGAPLASDGETLVDQPNVKIAHVERVEQLPSAWWSLESVDAVLLSTSSEESIAEFERESPQLAALETWVRMGGKLVIASGRHAQRLFASPAMQSSGLLPGTLVGMVPLRQSTPLEMYAETSDPLAVTGGRFNLEVPRLGEVRGRIEAFAGAGPRDLPLVVRSPHGFGEVVWTGFDLETQPLADWQARPQLLTKLLGMPSRAIRESEGDTLGQVTTLGFVDLAGQLRGALDQFAGVRMAPFWMVAVLVGVYILCIGPLDYFVVKRLFRRMEATWLTFGVTVLVFCAGAYALAYGFKGRQVRINQVDLVDFDATSGLVRGTTWLNVFSPKIDAYDLSLQPQQVAREAQSPARVLFSWLGLPGTGFGGMDSTSANLPLFTEGYDFSTGLDRLEAVPISVWSSKALVGRWWQQGTPPVEAELIDRGKLTGTLVSNLDAPLENAVLLYDRWAYPLRQVRPGQQFEIETDLDPQTADTYLRRVTVQGDRNVAPPYDRASFDIPRIVEVMTAHELAGGSKYTMLANDYQEFVDLSGLVSNGRAVLIGGVARPASQLQRDGQELVDARTEHWTFYRFVFEVRPADASQPPRELSARD